MKQDFLKESLNKPGWLGAYPKTWAACVEEYFTLDWDLAREMVEHCRQAVFLADNKNDEWIAVGGVIPADLIYAYNHKLSHTSRLDPVMHVDINYFQKYQDFYLDRISRGYFVMVMDEGKPVFSVVPDSFLVEALQVDESGVVRISDHYNWRIYSDDHIAVSKPNENTQECIDRFRIPIEQVRPYIDGENRQIMINIFKHFEDTERTPEAYAKAVSNLYVDLSTGNVITQEEHKESIRIAEAALVLVDVANILLQSADEPSDKVRQPLDAPAL